MGLAAGDIIGSYRVVRPLGEGGMGAVYEVEHTQLGVHYALKTYTFDGGHDELLRNKFLAEGKVLARLQDPHLVRVFDLNFDEQTGTPYFVMDIITYKDGEPHTLADVETDDLEEEYIRQWFGELAAALDYIHAQGIVHRDIKLNNVLLNADKRVVLSDFGVSRFFSQNLRKEISAVNSMVTEVTNGGRLVMGTQGYMAPEVERGEEATPAADVYSLGVMILHLLTGMWYESGSKALKFLDTLDYNWKDVLPQMLAEDPAARPTNLTALAGRVGKTSLLHDDESPVQKRRGRRFPVVVGLVVFVVLGLAAAWYFRRKPRVAPIPVANELQAGEFDAFFSSGGVHEVGK